MSNSEDDGAIADGGVTAALHLVFFQNCYCATQQLSPSVHNTSSKSKEQRVAFMLASKSKV